MKREVTRSIARRQAHEGCFGRCELAVLRIKLPHEDLIEPEIDMQYPFPGGIGIDHVGVRLVMAAEGKTAWRGVCRFGRSDVASILLDVGGFAEAAIGLNRQNGHGAAKVIRHEQMLAIGMHGEMCRTFAAGADGVHELQIACFWIDREGADGAGFIVAEAFRLVSRVKMGV